MKIFTRKIVSTPMRREGQLRRRGPPRSGHARLVELGDSGGGLSGSPRRDVACLGKPLRLGGGRLRLGVPVTIQGLCLLVCFGSVLWPDL